MEKVSVTVRLDEETVAFLDKLGEIEDRDRSYLVRKAVANYLALHRWQIEQIEQAVREADAGLFLSEKETEAFMDELRQ